MGLYLQRVLDGRSAADARAIGSLRDARSDALDHHHSPGVKRSPLETIFQLQLGDDPLAIVAIQPIRLQDRRAGGHDDGPHLETGLAPFPILDDHLIVADKALHVVQHRRGENLDVRVAVHLSNAGLHQRQRIVLRRVQLVQAQQQAAQLWRPLHELDFKAPVGQVERCRHTDHPPPNDQRRRFDRHLLLFQWLQQTGLGHTHSYQILRLPRGRLRLAHVHPGTLIANVGELKKVGVQSRLAARILKQWLVRARRAGSDHHPLQLLIDDGRLDLGQPGIGAGVHILLDEHDARQLPRVLCHRPHVHVPRNVAPAVTKEHANSRPLAHSALTHHLTTYPTTRAARAAAALACITDSGMSDGPRQHPAAKIPGRVISTGANGSVFTKPY